MTAPVHEPVMTAEVLALLAPARGGLFVDFTVGLGGHTRALLEAGASRVLGLDRDPQALAAAAVRLAKFGDRVTLTEGRHETLIDILKQQKIESVSGLLADLGVSSLQLDDASRGFSFRYDPPLDMRMGPESKTAADLVNTLGEQELASILREYGEEPMARRIAKAIVEARTEGPIETTARLAEIVQSVKWSKPGQIDPSTLTFQALRIAANEELVGLDAFIEDAVSVLESKARIAVISFHSLEDRIVKRAMRRLEGECTCPPNLPVCGCGAKEIVKILTSRPITASEEEVQRNPRSRSAKLRVAEKK
jgi:16S rRNA (cytosine1402-N4)-methyltransferase